MMFTPLSKKRAKELEIETINYINLLSKENKLGGTHKLIHEFHNWAGEETKDIFYKGLYEKVRYISDKLGMKQDYYVTYWVRNAVWAFMYNDNEYLLCYSNEGLSLYVPANVPPTEVIKCIQEITNRWKA